MSGAYHPDMADEFRLELITRQSFEEAGGRNEFPNLVYLGHVEGGCFISDDDIHHKNGILGGSLQIHTGDMFPKATHVFDYKTHEIQINHSCNFWVEGEAYGARKKPVSKTAKFEI